MSSRQPSAAITGGATADEEDFDLANASDDGGESGDPSGGATPAAYDSAEEDAIAEVCERGDGGRVCVTRGGQGGAGSGALGGHDRARRVGGGLKHPPRSLDASAPHRRARWLPSLSRPPPLPLPHPAQANLNNSSLVEIRRREKQRIRAAAKARAEALKSLKAEEDREFASKQVRERGVGGGRGGSAHAGRVRRVLVLAWEGGGAWARPKPGPGRARLCCVRVPATNASAAPAPASSPRRSTLSLSHHTPNPLPSIHTHTHTQAGRVKTRMEFLMKQADIFKVRERGERRLRGEGRTERGRAFSPSRLPPALSHSHTHTHLLSTHSHPRSTSSPPAPPAPPRRRRRAAATTAATRRRRRMTPCWRTRRQRSASRSASPSSPAA